jgi:hypothetical protein
MKEASKDAQMGYLSDFVALAPFFSIHTAASSCDGNLRHAASLLR